MKYEKKKSNSIFEGKSFYLIIALCLIAIGAASWMAYDRIQVDPYPNPSSDSSTIDNNSSLIQMQPTIEDEQQSVDKVDTEKNDVPYENTESEKSESKPTSEPKPEKPTATNFILPIMGNVVKHFSSDTLVYSNTYRDMRLHCGIDIIAEQGAEIKACGSGTVTAIIDDIKLGKYIEVDHGNDVIAKYCGFDSVYVKEGDTVDAITKLGTLGTVTEECEDASHLHLEFYKDGNSVDPLSIIYPK